MKILQITPYFLPHTGGIERYVGNLSKYLVKKGHDVEIYTSNIPRTKKIEIIDGTKIRRFTSIAEPLRNPLVPAFIFPHKDEIKKFDLIQVHLLYSSAAIFGHILKKVDNKPLILTHHGQMKFGDRYRNFIVRMYEKLIFSWLLKNADHAVVLSDSDAKFIASFGMDRNRISVIPNAICVEDFSYHNTIDTSDFIIKYKLENTVPILFVGELSARKGIIYLIKAFSILNSIELGSKVKLLIVGSGDQLETIRKAIIEYKMEDTVIFLEKISFVDLIKAYKSSKMLIVPSLSEGLPTVILEAYYFGLPVIASDIPGIKDHFSESSLLVPPQDEQALADAIIRLLKDNELANRLSSTGKEKVINNYTWDKIIDEYLDLYTRLIQKNSH